MINQTSCCLADSHRGQDSGALNGIKIIFLLPSLELGGAERQALLLARHLRDAQGAEVTVWGLEQPGRVMDICTESGLKCELVPFVATGSYVKDLSGILMFYIKLRRARPDIIIPYTLIPNILSGLVWKFTSARLCIWNQRDEGFNLDNTLFYHRWAVRNVSLFIANSSRGKDVLVNDFSLDPEKIELVRNGIELRPPEHDRIWWRKHLSLQTDEFVACMVANLHKYKDHLTLIRAWRMVVDVLSSEGMRSHLVLAGRYDGTEDLIRTEITTLGLQRHITLLGKVDDITGLLGAVDIGVFSSKSEGCPNGVLECMLSGIPVVATDIPGVHDAVGPSGRKWLVRPGDAEGFAQHVILLARNIENIRQTSGISNRERVEKVFGPKQMCEKTVATLCKHLSCAKPI